MRIFFCCDVHGSERCFKKFVNIAVYDVYKADILILSGDLTGKAIIPIIHEEDGSYRVKTDRIDMIARTPQDLHSAEEQIRNTGYYPQVFDRKDIEVAHYEQSHVDELFHKLMFSTMEQWMALVEERLKEKPNPVYVMPGNDDHPEIANIIRKSRRVVNPEDEVLRIDKHHEMISSGFSNPTPWKTPRECTEEELALKIENMASKVANMQNCIFNLHVPPYDTTLDIAPLLDENLRPVVSSGDFLKVPVGSKAVRASIEKWQPLLGLHGHIHESASSAKMGRTLCVNPGSEYHEGVLRGYLVDLDEKGVKRYLRVEG